MTLRPKNLKNKLIFFPEIENTSAGNGSTTPCLKNIDYYYCNKYLPSSKWTLL